MILRTDPRVTSYCGKNFKIKKYKFVSKDDNSFTYRLIIDGMRGECKAFIKTEKVTHSFLNSMMKEQIAYSKYPFMKKNSSPFTPINFNDIIMPSEATLLKINNLIKNSENSEVKNILNFSKEKFLNGEAHNTKDRHYNILNTPIEDSDTFYKFNTLVMLAEDSLVFNLRPIGPKYRSYDIEDTHYLNRTYYDVIRKLYNLTFNSIERNEKKISTEEFRNEIILQKRTQFEQRTSHRLKVFVFNCAIVAAAFFCLQILSKHTIDVTTVRGLQNKVMSTTNLQKFGKRKLICVSYRFNPFKREYNVKGLIFTEKNKFLTLQTKSLLNDPGYFKDLKYYNIEEKDGKNKLALV
jgi:hypothetical protein